MAFLSFLTGLFPSQGSFSGIFSLDPVRLAAQITLLSAAGLLVYLVFYATKDILQRTHSLLYQLCSIVLVAAVPFAGFLLYLLIRPSRTLHERTMEKKWEEVITLLTERKEQMAVVKQKMETAVRTSNFSSEKKEANIRVLPKKVSPAASSLTT